MLYPHNFAARDSILSLVKETYPEAPKEPFHSMVMLSGGIDSVAMLVNLLQHTDHEVHAHHVEFFNKEFRAQAENDTLEKSLAYIRANYRPFTYSSTRHEMMIGHKDKVGRDISFVMYMATRVNFSLENRFHFVWTGHYMQTDTIDYIEAGAIFAAASYKHGKKPVWMLPYLKCTKLDVYCSIPPELLYLTWTCRFPIYDANGVASECHNCRACATRKEKMAEFEKLRSEYK